MNNKLTLKWSDLLNFTEDDVIKNVLEKGGVYRLSHLNQEKEYIVFYVGKADNLKKRLLEHLSTKELNPCIKDKVTKGNNKYRFAYISNEEDRKNAEYTLYHEYNKPECNQNEPEGKKVEMNFE